MAIGYYEATTSAAPQTVCTALEAEANINSAEALGDVSETGSGIVDAATAAVNDVGDVAAGDTTITYDTLVGELGPILPVWATINSEIVKVTAYDGTTITVERGQQGTVAAAHSDNDVITFAAETLPQSNKVIFKIDGASNAAIIAAAAAVGGLQLASGYPTIS